MAIRKAASGSKTKPANPQPIAETSDPFFTKGLPNNLDAERSVLGAILLDNNIPKQAAALVKREEFFLQAHQILYERMLVMSEFGMSIDMVTLSEDLRRIRKFEDVGGATYIASLIDGVPRTDTVEPYTKIIRSKAQYRQIITVCNNAISAAFEQQDEPEQLIAGLQDAINRIARGAIPQRARLSGDIAFDYLTAVENISTNAKGARLLGLPTGFVDYDNLTSGQRRKKLTIVAARPGMGKTALLINWAIAVADAGGMPLLFSMEMGEDEIIERILSAVAKVDSHRMRHGYLNLDEWSRLASAAAWMREHPIMIDDSPGLTIPEARIRSLKVQNDYGLDWIGIDYLQLMHGTKNYNSREQEVSEVARGSKELAKELDVPVVATAQLSRATETRSNHRPTLGDLRESGEIEQAADIVCGLYRPELYEKRDDLRGLAELLLLKHRGGKCPWYMNLLFRPEWTRFFTAYNGEPLYSEADRQELASEAYEEYAL